MVTRWSTRPRWQHRHASVRREAVENGDSPELLAELPRLACDDADASVRIAALRRAADLALAQSRAEDDTDAGVRKTAQALYRDLLSGHHAASPPLNDRLRLLRAIDDRALREHLALNAVEPELREAALATHVRPGLVNERILDDPDTDLRLRLLAQIDDVDTLQRIATQSRRRDKQVAQIASQRVMAMRVAAGDNDAIQICAEQCCQRLEQAATLDRDTRTTLVSDTGTLWESLGDGPAAALARRYSHAREQLEAINAAADAPETAIAAAPAPPRPPREPEPVHASGTVAAVSLDTQRLAAEARFHADVAEGLQHAPAPRTPTPPRANIGKLLDQLEAALESGDLGATRHAEQALEKAPATELKSKQSARWQRARARAHELQRWQQWSTRRQRRQLCSDADHLKAAGLHPDALSNRVRELRSAWQALDALESGEPSAADRALKRRFNGLCQHALGAAKPYFKARDALRTQHSLDTRTLLDASAAALADDDAPDWRQLGALRKRMHGALRDLDKVAPATRKALADALHKQLRQLDARLGEHHDAIQAGHDQLIAQAQTLAENADAGAPARVRELQAQWKALGPGRRDRDNKQWRSFRAACDAIFAQRDQARQAVNEREQANIAQARRLIEQLQQATTSADRDTLQRARRDTQAAWRTLSLRDRNVSHAWRDALAAADTRITALEREAARAQFEQAFKATDVDAASTTRPALLAALRQRPSTPADPDAARDVLVRCEAMAGIDSPAEDQERRVALRLQRLQAALGAGERRSHVHELETILGEWIRLGPLPSEASGLHPRMQRALDAALDQL